MIWTQRRPRITQRFGLNPDIYDQFGLDGHNGIDYGVSTGTPIFAAHDGVVTKVKFDKLGYGTHIRLRDPAFGRETVYAHLSEVEVEVGDLVGMGDKIALSGNTGFSTGPHLHFGYRRLIPSKKDLSEWKVKDYSNGFFGWVDPIEFTRTWKGTSVKHTI
jgi:murein DD-endopeptidase MepM/ murein hydrolase activator NlpD|tara:strand:- start:128 stop:607 length:480 start_codon:yes stop_codon:yes gene_type:complete